MPELDILKLRNQFVQSNELIDLLENSIDQKRNSNEKKTIALEQRDPILKVLKDYLLKLQNLNISKFGPNPKLEIVLEDYNYAVKEKYYLS
ncbi:MAG: hypothetical protein DI598_12840 [Pseudopedobacter saltans]|uniref:Uncharacterized protein n=1 Tax=Pseudopedobacter saltans TaxID=151895 RepID=A0A2W5ETP4_9SPHI|nr:MAG: hypothetical protein DI598_12840 [Pseudopedobacter saltans]